ncbi:MAG: hypothetical protein KJ949_00020 [Nanoarchaeota archaeon]|nr:hypothetical protein [Nanoarchaeota archaeon]
MLFPKELLNEKEIELFNSLSTPKSIQDYLDNLKYNHGEDCKSPRKIIQEGTAHCSEGALFATAALWNLGHSPTIIELKAINDDDHIIAIYKENNCFGALAKSNFTTLRSREPVYKNLRELAMSYFDFYFNTIREKTLREFSDQFYLSNLENGRWLTCDKDLNYIMETFDNLPHTKLIGSEAEKNLSLVSQKLLEAGLLGSNPKGLYNPKVD